VLERRCCENGNFGGRQALKLYSKIEYGIFGHHCKTGGRTRIVSWGGSCHLVGRLDRLTTSAWGLLGDYNIKSMGLARRRGKGLEFVFSFGIVCFFSFLERERMGGITSAMSFDRRVSSFL